MSKYKVGDKVRIRHDLKCGIYGKCYVTEGMVSHAGEVGTVRKISEVYPNRFTIVEKLSQCEYEWIWSDEMVEPAYEIGDHVVVESSNIEYITRYRGETGVIERYMHSSGGFDYLIKMDRYPNVCIWCNVKCLVEEKKMFTKDDLKTGMFGVTNRGEKFVVVNDHLVYEDGQWDFAKLEFSNYHVEKVFDGIISFNELKSALEDKKNRKLVYDYNRDTKPVEPPKPLYNGKVVCIDSGVAPGYFTVGKIYTFVDGNGICDTGAKITNSPITDFNNLASRLTTVKFIEIKE